MGVLHLQKAQTVALRAVNNVKSCLVVANDCTVIVAGNIQPDNGQRFVWQISVVATEELQCFRAKPLPNMVRMKEDS